MPTTLKTPTRTVTLTLIDPKTGIDWSGDYVGNNRPAEMRTDPDGEVNYITDDATADWWVKQCSRQQAADDAVDALSSEQREYVERAVSSAGNLDLEDHPGATMDAIADLLEQGETWIEMDDRTSYAVEDASTVRVSVAADDDVTPEDRALIAESLGHRLGGTWSMSDLEGWSAADGEDQVTSLWRRQ